MLRWKNTVRNYITNRYNAVFSTYMGKQYKKAPPSGHTWDDVRNVVRFEYWRIYTKAGQTQETNYTTALREYIDQPNSAEICPTFTYDDHAKEVDASVEYSYLTWLRLGPTSSTPVSQLLPDAGDDTNGKSRRTMRDEEKQEKQKKQEKKRQKAIAAEKLAADYQLGSEHLVPSAAQSELRTLAGTNR